MIDTTEPTPIPGICYGYARVSDISQVESGLSLAVQPQQIEAYYHHRFADTGVVWGGMFVDRAVSAFKVPLRDREAGRQLDQRIEAGDHVVFAKLNRGFRSTVDMLQTYQSWQCRGVAMHFLDFNLDMSTPLGEFIATIMAAFSKMESQLKGNCVKEAMRQLSQQGYNIGKAPWGKRQVGKGAKHRRFVPEYLEQQIMKLIRHYKDVDGLSHERIALRLGYAGIKNPRCKSQRHLKETGGWSEHSVRNVYHAAVEQGLEPDDVLLKAMAVGK